MEKRIRIHYKEKYEQARTCAIIASILFLCSMFFLFMSAKANLDMQPKFISPDGVAAEIEVIK